MTSERENGGVAVRVHRYGNSAWRLQGQDWYTPWESISTTAAQDKAIARFADYLTDSI